MDAKLKKIWICLFLSLFAVFTVFSQAAVNRAAELINKNIIVYKYKLPDKNSLFTKFFSIPVKGGNPDIIIKQVI